MGKSYSLIGELLVSENFIQDFELEYALKIQKQRAFPKKIGQILIEKNIIDKENFRTALGMYYGVEAVDIINAEIDINAVRLIDLKTAFQIPCIPYDMSGRLVKVAVTDPRDCASLDKIRYKLDRPFKPVLAEEKDIINEVRFYSSQFR